MLICWPWSEVIPLLYEKFWSAHFRKVRLCTQTYSSTLLVAFVSTTSACQQAPRCLLSCEGFPNSGLEELTNHSYITPSNKYVQWKWDPYYTPWSYAEHRCLNINYFRYWIHQIGFNSRANLAHGLQRIAMNKTWFQDSPRLSCCPKSGNCSKLSQKADLVRIQKNNWTRKSLDLAYGVFD